jgi:ElaB/YqjD/DUF883 family membrane-anchored ribosome-binding protein
MNPEKKPNPDEILRELRALVSEAEKIIADAPNEKSDETFAALRRRFDAARERLQGIYAESKERVAAGARSTDHAIREHPYQSLLIAAGVGVIVGLVLGRKSDPDA